MKEASDAGGACVIIIGAGMTGLSACCYGQMKGYSGHIFVTASLAEERDLLLCYGMDYEVYRQRAGFIL